MWFLHGNRESVSLVTGARTGYLLFCLTALTVGHLSLLTNPDRIYIYLQEVTSSSEGRASTSDPLLRRTRIGHADRRSTRVLMDLRRPVRYAVEEFVEQPRHLIPSSRPVPAFSAIGRSKLDPPDALGTTPPAADRKTILTAPNVQTSVMELKPAEPAGKRAAHTPTLEDLAAKVGSQKQILVTQISPPTLPSPQAPPRTGGAPTPADRPNLARTDGTPPLEGPRAVRITRTSRPPTLEDFLIDPPVRSGTPITGFRQRSPGDGIPISEETTAYLSFDDKNLYVVFVCNARSGDIRAHLAKREDIDEDDNVAVYLDTFHDRRRAYVFSTNPLGVQRDGIITEGQQPDYNFDVQWQSRGKLTPAGFVVWIAIPFESLRFRAAAVQSWGIALGRSIIRTAEDAYWPYITDRIDGFVPQMATLEGLEQLSPARPYQLIPYGTLTRSRFLDPSVPDFRTLERGRAGLDSKFVLNKAFTLDLTLNPDFSEVESDDPQVLVNQRFEVFFPEKRPFFIENSGLFQTPENLFYSRRVADPEFGGRVTGKAGRWAIGTLASDDREPGRQLVSTDPAFGDRAALGVVRIQREIGNESAIGFLATTRKFLSSFNNVASVDTRLKLSPIWVFTGQAIRSFDRAPGRTRVQGAEYFANLSRNSRHFVYSATYLDRSPTLNAPLGFIQRVDIRQANQTAGYYWRPPDSFVVDYGPSVTTSIDWNRKGDLQDWSGTVDWSLDFKRATQIKIIRAEYSELFQSQHLRQHGSTISVSTSPTRWFSVSGSYDQGAVANYYPPAGIPPYVADAKSASFGFTLRPSPRLRFDETYLYTELALRTDSLPSVQGTPSILNNHLTRTKVNYQFTRTLSLRAILDYNAVLPNPMLVAQSRTKRIAPDALLTYLLSPGTAFYIGYHDQYDSLAIQEGLPRMLVPARKPELSTGRQFFMKVSYRFR